MEQLLDALKAYILANLPPYLAALTTADVPLVDLAEKNVVTGDCDITKYSGANILFINPDTIHFEDLTISDYDQKITVDFLMVCRAGPTPVLYRKVLRYVAALKKMFVTDLELGGLGTVSLDTQNYFDGMEGDAGIKGCVLSCEIIF